MEDWKLIAEFPNYDVSSLGNIRNNKTGKQMKLCVKSGYYHVCFVNDNSKKSFKVHRLVAMAFIENPEHKLEVNHKDKNKLNNSLSNDEKIECFMERFKVLTTLLQLSLFSDGFTQV